ncbi:hypothetical protein EVAR_83520_1 [Eumeta japonica]|uniref:Uncharacterized protein n=1 Tax=Eumeta variegata TaxID=151549 RepID=A0A4C1Y2K1_EUMVA|nr:hypothetical protein EVAR_83520_1 [Eumeta japonica]
MSATASQMPSESDEFTQKSFLHSTRIGSWVLVDFSVLVFLCAMTGLLTSRVSELTAACVDLLERQVDGENIVSVERALYA